MELVDDAVRVILRHACLPHAPTLRLVCREWRALVDAMLDTDRALERAMHIVTFFPKCRRGGKRGPFARFARRHLRRREKGGDFIPVVYASIRVWVDVANLVAFGKLYQPQAAITITDAQRVDELVRFEAMFWKMDDDSQAVRLWLTCLALALKAAIRRHAVTHVCLEDPESGLLFSIFVLAKRKK
jgi:hypothetical protein